VDFANRLETNAMMLCDLFEYLDQNIAVTVLRRGMCVFAVTAHNQFSAAQGFEKRGWTRLIPLPH